MERGELIRFLADELKVSDVQDYCPNGLQVEGSSSVELIACGVTASQAFIDKAIACGADTLLVHHGYFWRGEEPVISGIKKQRLKKILENDLNLLAYHLPLDLHPVIGNNAQLARVLGFRPDGRFGRQNLGWFGTVEKAGVGCVGELAAHIEKVLGRPPMLVGDVDASIGRIAWCSGAAQGMLTDAVNAGSTVFLSGEISEQTVHEAREYGVAYLACGHHATETYGIRALGQLLTEKFGVNHVFFDVYNPV